MYQEKVVANFIVALLSNETLKDRELDELKDLCVAGFETPNTLVGVVKNMIAGAAVDLNDKDFRQTVRDFAISFIVSEDSELSETLRRAKTVLRVDELSREIKGLKEEIVGICDDELRRLDEAVKHVVVYSVIGEYMWVTETVTKGNQVKAEFARLPIEKGYRFLDFAKKHGAEIEIVDVS